MSAELDTIEESIKIALDAADAAIRVDLHPQCLNIVCAVGSTGKVGQVELDLIPPLIQTHGHRA